VSGKPSATMLRMRAHPDGGEPYIIAATARDVLIWERTGKGKVFQELVRSQAMVDLYRIAHISATRQGLYSDDLRSFELTVDLENLDAEDDDDEQGEGGADPTQSAQ
jgi:hypothetical protein